MASITLQPGRSELKRMCKMARTKDRPNPHAPSLAGKTVVLTGGSSGFGLACAHILPTLHLTHLILGVRSVRRGEEAASAIRRSHPHTTVDVWELDMLDYRSVHAFAQRCATLPRLDVAILNAGLGNLEYAVSRATGHEEIIQVNYLSTALLSILLLPVLRPKAPSSPPGRLTIVGSAMGLNAKFAERDAIPLIPAFDREWKGMQAAAERYAVSKTLVFMLVLKMSQVVGADQVVVNTVDPGYSGATGLSREARGVVAKAAMGMLHAVLGRTAEQGAWTYVDAAVTRGEETHGSFLVNWEIYP